MKFQENISVKFSSQNVNTTAVDFREFPRFYLRVEFSENFGFFYEVDGRYSSCNRKRIQEILWNFEEITSE